MKLIKKNIFFFIVFLFVFFVIWTIYAIYKERQEKGKLIKFLEEQTRTTKEFQQKIIQNFPILEDYLNKEKFQELRKNLYPKHIQIAYKSNLEIIKNKEDLEKETSIGNFINLENPEVRKFYFFYNLPKENRYLRKEFYKTLVLIGQKFNEKIHYQNKDIIVKLALSSVLRTEDYQKKLKKSNLNAIENSTHSYGISFDIFYDEFYVSLEYLCNDILMPFCKNYLNHYGYVLGGNLRRQFQSILAETLIELQQENQLYVILETNQKVFHITPIPR
ncbi:MAG: DUF5715 family protein [Leptonema sp. (in: bacteria)]